MTSGGGTATIRRCSVGCFRRRIPASSSSPSALSPARCRKARALADHRLGRDLDVDEEHRGFRARLRRRAGAGRGHLLRTPASRRGVGRPCRQVGPRLGAGRARLRDRHPPVLAHPRSRPLCRPGAPPGPGRRPPRRRDGPRPLAAVRVRGRRLRRSRRPRRGVASSHIRSSTRRSWTSFWRSGRGRPFPVEAADVARATLARPVANEAWARPSSTTSAGRRKPGRQPGQCPTGRSRSYTHKRDSQEDGVVIHCLRMEGQSWRGLI